MGLQSHLGGMEATRYWVWLLTTIISEECWCTQQYQHVRQIREKKVEYTHFIFRIKKRHDRAFLKIMSPVVTLGYEKHFSLAYRWYNNYKKLFEQNVKVTKSL